MKIYVQDIAAYANSRLHGTWIDMEGKSEDDILREIEVMLSHSPVKDAEEWAIFDSVAPFTIPEDMDLGELVELQEELEDLGPVLEAALAAGWQADYAMDRARNAFLGYYDDLGEFAYEHFDGVSPADHYTDWDAVGRDMELSGDVTAVDLHNHLFVFDNR